MIPIRYNLRSLLVRKTTTAATALGIALVIFVLAGALMLASGVKKTLASTGERDNAVVLRVGSDNELSSVIEDHSVGMILAAPGVKKDNDSAVGVSEIIVVTALDKLGTVGISNVLLRGVPENGIQFRPRMRIVTGRAPRPGTDEVMVGQAIRGRFRGLDLGQSFELRKNRMSQVVGVFSDAGSSYESEVWIDREVLKSAYRREGVVSAVRVRLQSPQSFDVFKAAVTQDKHLGFQAFREIEYYEKQSEGTSNFVGIMGTLVAVFFSIGAMIGAMITMYAAVANRQREIGTLRALGFSRFQVLLSFLFESTVLALAGGILGTAIAGLMGFVKFSMMNFASFSEVVFEFKPTPTIVAITIIFSGVMGLFGGLFPAVRAARVSAADAMRG